MTMITSLLRVTTRRLPRSLTPHLRAASTSIPHLAGHPGPSASSTTTSTKPHANPSDEARKAAELMRKLQEDPAFLNKIHNDQPMYTKPEGPDSLPGDRTFKRSGGASTQEPGK